MIECFEINQIIMQEKLQQRLPWNHALLDTIMHPICFRSVPGIEARMAYFYPFGLCLTKQVVVHLADICKHNFSFSAAPLSYLSVVRTITFNYTPNST